MRHEDATPQQANLWPKDLMQKPGIHRHHAYKVLSATLHTVRDRIGPEHAVHLGAQLPMLIRGFFFEGWYPARTPTRQGHKDEFLDYVNGEIFRASASIPIV
jgi:uncharacterized protein (DUF2267 family)